LNSGFTRASFHLLGKDPAENGQLNSMTSSSHKTGAKSFNQRSQRFQNLGNRK